MSKLYVEAVIHHRKDKKLRKTQTFAELSTAIEWVASELKEPSPTKWSCDTARLYKKTDTHVVNILPRIRK